MRGAGVALDIVVDGDTDLARDLTETQALLEDPAKLHQAISEVLITGGINAAGRRVFGFEDHIRQASYSRHATATRLGATPTGYLMKAAETLEVHATTEHAVLAITAPYSEIFKRAVGEVEVHVRDRKWLAIPCDKRTYGLSPLNFPGMLDFFVIIPNFLAAWRMRKEPKKEKLDEEDKPEKAAKPEAPGVTPKGHDDIVFWGRKSTTLSEDRELLPSEENLYALVELGLSEAIDSGALE